MHNMLKTAFSGNNLVRTQTSGWSFKFKYGEAMLEDCDNSGHKDEIMEAPTIKDNKSSSLRRSLVFEASRMGHASELKARAQIRGRSPRRLFFRCSPRSRSSSRDFRQLITWLWSATLLKRPIWPLMIPSVPTMTLKFWNNRLPYHTSFQKVSFSGASSSARNAGLVA